MRTLEESKRRSALRGWFDGVSDKYLSSEGVELSAHWSEEGTDFIEEVLLIAEFMTEQLHSRLDVPPAPGCDDNMLIEFVHDPRVGYYQGAEIQYRCEWNPSKWLSDYTSIGELTTSPTAEGNEGAWHVVQALDAKFQVIKADHDKIVAAMAAASSVESALTSLEEAIKEEAK
jgi:hypothetical protein